MKTTHTFPSKSNPNGKPHTVTIDGPVVTCSCRGFKSYKHCWHVDTVLAGQPTAPPPPPSPRLEPMLASALPDGRSLEDYASAAYVMEEKVDGHRIILEKPLGTTYAAWSRGLKPRTLPPHIVAALQYLPAGTYDGELVVPGGISTDVTRDDRASSLQYIIFDILRVDGQDCMRVPGDERRRLLELACSKLPDNAPVKLITRTRVDATLLAAIWARGGEGVIVKHAAARYTPGARSTDWVKFKRNGAAHVTITGFEAGKLGPHSKVVARDADGVEVTVKTLNDEWRAMFERHAATFIGRTLVISYQQKTRDGRYRHPMADHIL